MTADEFKALTGQDPVQDDLERVNCDQVGQPRHFFCGVMPCCGVPRFMGCDCKEQS